MHVISARNGIIIMNIDECASDKALSEIPPPIPNEAINAQIAVLYLNLHSESVSKIHVQPFTVRHSRATILLHSFATPLYTIAEHL